MSEDVTKIDINQADITTLADLPGVGEVLAQRIIEYRETVRPFTDIDELTAVPGISANMVAQFADQIIAAPPEPETAVAAADETDEFAAFVAADDVVDGEEDDLAGFAPADEEPEPEIIFLTDGESAAEAVEDEPDTDETAVSPEPALLIETTPAQEPETEDIAAIVDPPILKERMRQEARSQEPMSSDQSPPAQPVTPPAETDVPRKGIGLGLWLFGVILGALLGSALTLFLLATLNNGNLQYSASDAQLARALQTSNQSQDQLAAQVAILVTGEATIVAQLDDLTSDQESDQQSFAEVTTMIADLDSGLVEAAALVTALEANTAVLEERVNTVAAASETFDTFLTSLRDLLIDVQGLPPTPVPTATMTPTITVTPLTDDDMTPTGTVRPTRTPRPTSTPFATSDAASTDEASTSEASSTPEEETPTHTPVPQP